MMIPETNTAVSTNVLEAILTNARILLTHLH